MPFLLGFFGSYPDSSCKQRLITVARQYAAQETFQTLALDNGFVCTGYKHDESFCSDKITMLEDLAGVFVGKLFERETSQKASFNVADIQKLIESPEYLFKAWWGRYVGLLYNQKTQTCTFIRDPQGLSTLFYIIKPNYILFSTDIAYLYDVLEDKPAINLSYFAEYIAGKQYISAVTPFEGIQELLPGMALCMQSSGKYTTDILWDISSVQSTFINDIQAFEEELSFTLRTTLKALVGDSSGVCLELSGGLDSSGLMILLKDVLPEHNLIGVNYIDSKTPSSNEYEYAKEVANKCNTSLYSLDWQNVSLIDPLTPSWRPDKPTSFLLFHENGKQLRNLARQYGCSEIINGQGGDHVFLAPYPNDCLADYWFDRGLRGITTPLKELSSINRMPLWEITRDTIKNIIAHYYNKPEVCENKYAYFSQDFHYNYRPDEFFLQSKINKFYPAKKDHVKGIFHGILFADRSLRIPDCTITHPLLSQPVVEMGLRIPTYQSFKNGYDRIFFRNTVNKIQQSTTLWRTMKGETTSSITKSFATHAPELLDTILQGRLVYDGLVNKEWVEEQMTYIRHGKIDNLWPIIRILTAQRWLNMWEL